MAIASNIFIEGQVVGLEYGSAAVEHGLLAGVRDAAGCVELIGDFVPVGFLEEPVHGHQSAVDPTQKFRYVVFGECFGAHRFGARYIIHEAPSDDG